MNPLYTIPLNCHAIISKQKQETCSLAESIRQHIHLIFRTHLKECRYNNEFGSILWEKDFETIRSVYKWKNDLTESFYKPLVVLEKRLDNVQVNTYVDAIQIVDAITNKVVEVRKRINVTVEGLITVSNEKFFHKEQIFFSPLSLV